MILISCGTRAKTLPFWIPADWWRTALHDRFCATSRCCEPTTSSCRCDCRASGSAIPSRILRASRAPSHQARVSGWPSGFPRTFPNLSKVPATGIEPVTHALGKRCSIQLSYASTPRPATDRRTRGVQDNPKQRHATISGASLDPRPPPQTPSGMAGSALG